MTDADIYREVDEYFKNLNERNAEHKFHFGDCCYLGTVGERVMKYREIELRKKKEKNKEKNKEKVNVEHNFHLARELND